MVKMHAAPTPRCQGSILFPQVSNKHGTAGGRPRRSTIAAHLSHGIAIGPNTAGANTAVCRKKTERNIRPAPLEHNPTDFHLHCGEFLRGNFPFRLTLLKPPPPWADGDGVPAGAAAGAAGPGPPPPRRPRPLGPRRFPPGPPTPMVTLPEFEAEGSSIIPAVW